MKPARFIIIARSRDPCLTCRAQATRRSLRLVAGRRGPVCRSSMQWHWQIWLPEQLVGKAGTATVSPEELLDAAIPGSGDADWRGAVTDQGCQYGRIMAS